MELIEKEREAQALRDSGRGSMRRDGGGGGGGSNLRTGGSGSMRGNQLPPQRGSMDNRWGDFWIPYYRLGGENVSDTQKLHTLFVFLVSLLRNSTTSLKIRLSRIAAWISTCSLSLQSAMILGSRISLISYWSKPDKCVKLESLNFFKQIVFFWGIENYEFFWPSIWTYKITKADYYTYYGIMRNVPA